VLVYTRGGIEREREREEREREREGVERGLGGQRRISGSAFLSSVVVFLWLHNTIK